MSGAKRRGNYSTPQTFTFSLKVSGLVGCALGLVVLLSSFFALGVVVGRGYQPESAVPELARLIPTPDAPAAEGGAAEEPGTVLKAEDLQFMDRLKNEKTASAAHAGAEAAKKKPSVESSAQPKKAEFPKPVPEVVQPKKAEAATVSPKKVETSKAEAVELAERIERKALNAPAVKASKGKVPAASETGDQTVYDYIYQAASFKQKDMAEAFREKITALGLGASIQKAKSKSSTWYRVVVHFQGRPEETREMKAKLRTVGVKRPIMQSKKPL